jgi:hypothetical protein
MHYPYPGSNSTISFTNYPSWARAVKRRVLFSGVGFLPWLGVSQGPAPTYAAEPAVFLGR